MDNNLNIMLWNARSIYKNLGEFQKRVEESKPFIICITETWLSHQKNFNLKGFQIFRKKP